MSTWAWVGVGFGAFFLNSVLLGLALAAILGRIGRASSEVLESAQWAQAPPTREQVEAKTKAASAVDDRRKRRRVGRLRHHGLRARHRAPS